VTTSEERRAKNEATFREGNERIRAAQERLDPPAEQERACRRGRRRARPAKGGDVTDEHARRVGLNEALFRQVNEQIRGLTRTFGTSDATMTVICECGDVGCTTQLEVAIGDYERIRSGGRQFVVATGHEFPELEQIVERREGWDVVRKREGVPTDLSRETDPRA
jgi:hypothetical protein